MAENRSSKGRKKIEMKKIRNEEYLQVTFSKRRAGLFKKANELYSLCGAEIAILLSSPAGTVFSFGHPSVETVIDRFVNRGTPQEPSVLPSINHEANVPELTRRYTDIVTQLEDGEMKGKELKAPVLNANNGDLWWEDPLDTLDLEDLQHLKFAVGYMKESLLMNTRTTVNNAVIAPHGFGFGFHNGLGS
ncbi:agamous-like MADS-box protein AGL62 [Telopea speciosissima]|uniref:agamous-like MADS-box protein AGL62 n=1 Tax=Telopea speciosissima TaxID=54955 RepID=UPI001CC34D70|nr:agamous-like MADS-box protein AGL62 [Telopea speciosissima]